MRRWTAIIRVDLPGAGLVVEADQSDCDLMRDQTQAAVRQAAQFANDVNWVHVDLYKTTKGGTVRDRTFSVVRDRSGQIRYQ